MANDDVDVFWDLVDELREDDPRLEEGTLMNGRCVRVDGAFLAMAFGEAGLVVKLPRTRVAELIEQGIGQPFAPAGKVFAEWASVPECDPDRWRALLLEGVGFVAPRP